MVGPDNAEELGRIAQEIGGDIMLGGSRREGQKR